MLLFLNLKEKILTTFKDCKFFHILVQNLKSGNNFRENVRYPKNFYTIKIES